MANRKKGFTLVELLIVIVVIGVLSAMMMLSSTEAVSSAKATNIINNMRNLKTAALEWYTDNMDRIRPDSLGLKTDMSNNNSHQSIETYFGVATRLAELTKYLGNSSSIKWHDKLDSAQAGEFVFVNNAEATGSYGSNDYKKNKDWYIAYKIVSPGKTQDASLKEKLKGRASTALLLKERKRDSAPYDGGDIVYMHVLALGD